MVRRFLAVMRRRRELFGIVCIFYIRIGLNIARITVKSVLLKQTIKEKHTVTNKKDKQAVEKSDTVKEVNMIEGYWLICENTADLKNRFEETLKNIPPRNYLIDYLRRAITVEWSRSSITKFTYRKLSQSEIDEIALIHKQHLELMKQKLAEEKLAIGSVKKIFSAGLLDQAAARKIDA